MGESRDVGIYRQVEYIHFGISNQLLFHYGTIVVVLNA